MVSVLEHKFLPRLIIYRARCEFTSSVDDTPELNIFLLWNGEGAEVTLWKEDAIHLGRVGVVRSRVLFVEVVALITRAGRFCLCLLAST